jgi:large repetitive protein
VSGKLRVVFSNPSRQLEVALHGRGVSSILSVTPALLDFGTRLAGGEERELPLTLTNVSNEPIVLSAPEVIEKTGTFFSFDAERLEGLTLEAGRSFILPVGYQPEVDSVSEMTLDFGTSTPLQPRMVQVKLQGRGVQRVISMAPGRADFSHVAVDEPSEPRVITLVNTSSHEQQVVVGLKDTNGTPFNVDVGALASSIPPGGSSSFKVSFLPRQPGDAQNEVQVWVQGTSEPQGVIALTGTGTEAPQGGCACGSSETGSAGGLVLMVMIALVARQRRLSQRPGFSSGAPRFR